MWGISNSTDFPAEASWVQDKDANKIWLVCIKATFDITSDGRTVASDTQVPPVLQGQPIDGDFNNSLIYESDFLGVKPLTDVLLNGTAGRPNGKPATELDVGLRVGRLQKRLRIFGDRWWNLSLAGGQYTMTAPEYFLNMAIQYERAFGGWDRTATDTKDHRLDPRNPVGQGFISNPTGHHGRRLPNVENPADLLSTWRSNPAPAGFNAIACHWSPRRELAGTYDDAWMKSRFPLWAVDFDPRYYCCAPRDQQVEGYLRGGEPVEMFNLSPNGPIRFELPRLVFGFSTRKGRETIHHRGTLATVILEPEFPRVSMVWQSSLVCNRGQDDLDWTAIRLKKLI